MDKTAYQPGESGEIKAYFSSRSFAGKVSKTIRVTTNSERQRSIQIGFTVNVVTDLKPTSNLVNFKQVLPDTEYTVEIPIMNEMGKPLEIRKVEPVGDADIIRLFPVSVDRVAHEKDPRDILRFTLKTGHDLVYEDRVSYTLKVLTNAEVKSEMEFVVRVELPSLLDVDPRTLFAFGLKKNQQHARRIRVQSNVQEPLQVISVKSDIGWLDFEVESESDRRSFIWLNVGDPDTTGNGDSGESQTAFNTTITIQVRVGTRERTIPMIVRGNLVDK